MRHGLTLGEAAHWFVSHFNLDVTMKSSRWRLRPHRGRAWLAGRAALGQPHPNAASLNMVRAHPGTVVLEGCTLSEGRGTTIRLSHGRPDIRLASV